MFDLSLACLCFGEFDQGTHAPVMISTNSANTSRSTSLQLALKHTAHNVDICGLLDEHDTVSPLIFDSYPVWILRIVCIASLWGSEGHLGSAVSTESEVIDCSTVNDGLDQGEVGRDWKTAKDNFSNLGTCLYVSDDDRKVSHGYFDVREVARACGVPQLVK
jgi:hypothetical protein